MMASVSLSVTAISSQVNRAKVDARRLRIQFLNHAAPARHPLQVQVETSSRCNLRCVCCSHSRESETGTFLTVDSLQSMLAKLSLPFTHVHLSGNGEPLLNPDFFPSIDLLDSRGLTCNFFTNGTLLTPSNREAVLIRRNITMMGISCDGSSKETFERCRTGADFERWLEFVGKFISASKEHRPDLNITMFVTLNKSNASEAREIVLLAAKLGFTNIQLNDVVDVDEITHANVLTDDEFAGLGLDELSKLARSRGLGAFSRRRRNVVPPQRVMRCLEPWQRPFIRANGNVQPCAAVFGSERAAVMGNIHEEPFLGIWNGDRYAAFRTGHVKGTNPQCRACPQY